jgi:hypothetical protein
MSSVTVLRCTGIDIFELLREPSLAIHTVLYVWSHMP